MASPLAPPPPLAAQVSPADSAAVLVRAAEDLVAEGRSEAAEEVLRYVLDRFGDTPAAIRASDVLDHLLQTAAPGTGRVELQVWSATYGLWLGIAVPAAFDANDSEAYGLGLLLGGPAGFLAGNRLANARRPTTGQARAITLGGTWGTWQGWGWTEVFDWGTEEVCYEFGCYEEDSGQRGFTGAILGGLTGLGIGTALSDRQISPGMATTINFGALWGTWFGVAGGVLLDLENDALLASTLLGGDAGLVGAALAYPGWRFTRNRARLISIAGVVGGLAGAGIDLLAQPDDEKLAIAIPLATSVIGLLAGAARTRGGEAEPEPGFGPEGGGADLGALIQLDGGRLGLGTPMPVPTRVLVEHEGGRRRVTQLRIPLLRGRF